MAISDLTMEPVHSAPRTAQVQQDHCHSLTVLPMLVIQGLDGISSLAQLELSKQHLFLKLPAKPVQTQRTATALQGPPLSSIVSAMQTGTAEMEVFAISAQPIPAGLPGFVTNT